MPVKIYAYGEKVDRGVYVWYFPVLGLYGLFCGTITSHRWFISRKLRSCFRDAVSRSKKEGIQLPEEITKKTKIIKKVL